MVEELPNVNIRDLAHAGNRTPVAEFLSHGTSHYTTDPKARSFRTEPSEYLVQTKSLATSYLQNL